MRLALAWVDTADPTDRSVIEGLVPELRALGNFVCLVGPRRRPGEPYRGTFRGIPVYRVGPDEALAVSQLHRINRREAIDVWHCHAFARSHRPLIRAASSARWPMVLTLHLVLRDYLPFIGGVPGLRKLLKPAHGVSLVAEASRKEFLRLCPEWRRRSSVIYLGTKLAPAAAVRPRDISKPYALSVARLAPYKGQDILLMAFAKVLDKRPNLRLVLCGRDQLDGAVERFVRALGLESRVTLTGELPQSRVRGLMRGCEFFVLPSRRENLPLAILEAMASGKAVIAASIGGLPEVVRDGKEGLLIEPNDVDALARAMLDLSGDRDLRDRLGRQARLRSREFTWSAAAAAFEGLCARAWAERSPESRL
jgi:glycosyltransferase involved in cell wall biosynthesis